ncbi:hypothetical protein MXB_5377, partial [Myxobolus squamalis]
MSSRHIRRFTDLKETTKELTSASSDEEISSNKKSDVDEEIKIKKTKKRNKRKKISTDKTKIDETSVKLVQDVETSSICSQTKI